MEITVMSREMIKPSSPTPHHLKHLKISLIDQFMPAIYYIRLLLFYSAQGDVHRFRDANMSDRFKKSLSEVLTDFYPLAGKFNSADHSIDCNDAGLEYTEARVKAPLTLGQLLACPDPEELDRLQPRDAYNYGEGFRGLSAIQVTVFEQCGGMAIGVSLSHKLTDGASLLVFINTWAAVVARGDKDKDETKTLAAVFNTASLFPPRDIPEQKYEISPEGAKKFTVKRFVFSKSKIDRLKANFTYQRPTRVEVVSALLFKCMIKACKSTPDFLGTTIDIRSRMSLPLPVHYFGNLILSLPVKLVRSSDTLNDMGMELRRVVKEMDGDYVEKLQADNASLLFEYLDQLAKFEGGVGIGVSSMCRVPIYEADVGWGVPTWVAGVCPTWENCFVLMDTKYGNGIEAWVTMDKADMALLESDNELLAFASANPMVSKL